MNRRAGDAPFDIRTVEIKTFILIKQPNLGLSGLRVTAISQIESNTYYYHAINYIQYQI